MAKITLCLSALIVLTGCSSVPVITKTEPVVIERKVYIPIPVSYFAACPGKPALIKDAKTNGDLLWIAIGHESNYVPCLEERLMDLQKLQP